MAYRNDADYNAPEVAYHHAPQVVPQQDHYHQQATTGVPHNSYYHDPTVPDHAKGGDQKLYDEGRGEEVNDGRRKRKTVLGLSPKVFWIVIILLAIILAAGIGGGLGGGLAGKSKKQVQSSTNSSPYPTLSPSSSSSTGTNTPSSSTSSARPTSSSLTSCPTSDSTLYTPLNAAASKAPYSINGTTLSYKIFCSKNFADASSGNNLGIHKLQQTLNFVSLEDCITACAAYNGALTSATPKPAFAVLCSGVVYVATNKPTSCDLNSGVKMGATTVLYGPEMEIDSAILVWSS